MIFTIIIAILTCLFLILAVLFKPVIKIKSLSIQTFWIITLIGALLLIIFGSIDLSFLLKKLTSSSAINPLKILVLFISISFLSITLDELGFFSYIAVKAVNKVKNNQYKLFFMIYAIVSILTIFTSNDIVILTFTPFICYFAKRAKINPIPYLIMEFINANTYSMLLSIGNPTNIYLSQSFNIDFLQYVKIMALPTLLCGITSLLLLLLLFNKQLKQPIESSDIPQIPLKNKKLIIINLIHLGLTTILLAISNYINLEMWIICLAFSISLLIFVIIHTIKKHDGLIKYCIIRLPFNLIPFLISMFTIVSCLEYQGVIDKIAQNILKITNSSSTTLITYLGSSTILCNLMNNIPMTVFYSSLISASSVFQTQAIFASIAGSNIGAFLTPVGALAGIMWMSILKKQEVDFSFVSFVKYGLIFVTALILAAFLGFLIIF